MNKTTRSKRLLALALCLPLLICLSPPATATGGEWDDAVRYVTEQEIYTGDDNGDLNLESGLTRAELAVILTRLEFSQPPGDITDWDAWGLARFSDPENRYNKVSDIPDWAMPYVEYCYQRGLMKGVGGDRFDPQGAVNPQMACTVILRYCRIAETDWSYDTSVEKAQVLGIAPSDGIGGNDLLRGTMAVIIHKGMTYATASAPTSAESPTPAPLPSPEDEPQDTEPKPRAESVMTIDEMKAEIVRLTNEARIEAGVPALEVHPTLMETAQAKADDWRNNHYYGHNSPSLGAPGEQIKAALPEAKSAGENIAPWRETAKEVVEGWLGSEGHRANILATKFTHIGIGIIEGKDGGYWFSQQFVGL
jgi:uncharacterized protein YkwD